MNTEIPQWSRIKTNVITMKGSPIFIERLLKQHGNVSFKVIWERDDETIRTRQCLDLPSALSMAVRWVSERNLFGDPPSGDDA